MAGLPRDPDFHRTGLRLFIFQLIYDMGSLMPSRARRRYDMSEFEERLIQLRNKSQLSLKEICTKVGIPPSRLVELERGVRIPTAGQIEHLEHFYGVNSGELSELAESLETGDW